MSKPRFLIVLGAPGSGKGTQCKLLATENSSWKHISTGDLFRKEISSGSSQGIELKKLLDAGQLVPDDVTMKVFESQVDQIVRKEKVDFMLLDGCIRTKAQAEYLKDLCQRRSNEFSDLAIIELHVPEEVLVKRLTGRLINPRTGRIYHVTDNPPKVPGVCDEDGGPLEQRGDDKEEVIRKRFQIYRNERDPILEVLDKNNSLVIIDGNQDPSLVTMALTKVIKKLT